MSRRRLDLGDWAESLAADFLQGKGMRILGRKVRTRGGEIDLVMEDRDTLVFVEVKSLRRAEPGAGPAENVHAAKRRRLARAASAYLAGLERSPYCRFDVVTVLREPETVLEHHPGAFLAAA